MKNRLQFQTSAFIFFFSTVTALQAESAVGIAAKGDAINRAPAILEGSTELYQPVPQKPQWMDCAPVADSMSFTKNQGTPWNKQEQVPEPVAQALATISYVGQKINKKTGEVVVYFLDARKQIATNGKTYQEWDSQKDKSTTKDVIRTTQNDTDEKTAHEMYFIRDSAPVHALTLKLDAGPYVLKTDQGDVRVGTQQKAKVSAALNQEIVDAAQKNDLPIGIQSEFPREIDLRTKALTENSNAPLTKNPYWQSLFQNNKMSQLSYAAYKKDYAEAQAKLPAVKGSDEEASRTQQIREACVAYIKELKKNPASTPENFFTNDAIKSANKTGSHLPEGQCKTGGKGC